MAFSGFAAPSSKTVRGSAHESAAKYAACAANTGASALSAKCKMTSLLLPGAASTSARMLRMRTITSMMLAISRSAVSSTRLSSASGHGATMMLLPSCGTRCQISSVRNGMKGCSRRSVRSKTDERTYCAVFCERSPAASLS